MSRRWIAQLSLAGVVLVLVASAAVLAILERGFPRSEPADDALALVVLGAGGSGLACLILAAIGGLARLAGSIARRR